CSSSSPVRSARSLRGLGYPPLSDEPLRRPRGVSTQIHPGIDRDDADPIDSSRLSVGHHGRKRSVADHEHPGLPDPVDVLRRLGQGLPHAARQLEASGETALAALVPEIDGFTRALEGAADTLAAAGDAARGPAQLLWLHEIRGAVTTVVGWVDLLV